MENITYTKNGVDYVTTQLPYIDYDCERGNIMRVSAEDEEGNDYYLTWDLLDVESDDDSDLCDWDDFSVRKL